jgi:hypothetical protein
VRQVVQGEKAVPEILAEESKEVQVEAANAEVKEVL